MENLLLKSLRSVRKSIGHRAQILSNALNAEEKPALSNGAGKLPQVSEKVNPSNAQKDAGQKDVEQHASEPKPVPAFRIQAYDKGLWAVCSSCGSLHPLDAVCHACGRPLCTDTHCRIIKRHPQLKRDVIVCSACKDTL